MSHHDREWNKPDEGDSSSPEDTLVTMRAELDQMLMLAPELARVCCGWFDSFKAEDFSDAQALYLTAVQIQSDPGEAPS